MIAETAYTLATVAGISAGGVWAMTVAEFTPDEMVTNVAGTVIAAIAGFAMCLSVLKFVFQ